MDSGTCGLVDDGDIGKCGLGGVDLGTRWTFGPVDM